jgi:hypothetical protein
MAGTFETTIQNERERLTKAREDAQARLEEIQKEIADIDREFEAIEAYERVKADKPRKGVAPSKGEAASKKPARQRARRGERQEELLNLIGENPDGLTRGEILEQLGVKGDKKAEASISNALNNLKKTDDSDPKGRATYCLNEQPTTERGPISLIAQSW